MDEFTEAPAPEATRAPETNDGVRRDPDAPLRNAGFYALFLRESGYAPQAAAYLVAKRYPAARPKLARFLRHGSEGAA